MNCTVVIPALMQAKLLWPQWQLNKKEFPALYQLLSNFSNEPMFASVEQMLSSLFNVDIKSMPAIQALLATDQENKNFMRADPIMLNVDHHNAYCIGNEALALTGAQRDKLILDLNQFLVDDGLVIHEFDEHQWLLATREPVSLNTLPTHELIGKSLHDKLPSAAYWLRLFTECQMWLQQHPVNQEREQQGLPLVNAIWFWGGAALSNAQHAPVALLCAHSKTVQAIAQWQQIEYVTAGESFTDLQSKLDSDTMIVLEQLVAPLAQGDPQEWQNQLLHIELNWLQPMLEALKQSTIKKINLMTDGGHSELSSWRAKYWPFIRQHNLFKNISKAEI